MNTNKSNTIVIGAGAMLALIVSLPLDWMTIHSTESAIVCTGLDGLSEFMTFKLPTWLVVVTGLTGVLLALLNNLRVTSLSKLATLVPLTLCTLYVLEAIRFPFGIYTATVEVGPFVALVGLALGYVQAFTCRINPKANTT